MTTYAFPSALRAPARVRWELMANTQTFVSPLTGAVQTLEIPGARWRFAAQWGSFDAADGALMRAFLAKLRGQANRFTCSPWGHETPRGAGGGTPLVKGGSQTGATLAIDGGPTSITGWLLAGDYFTVNGELKILTADASTDGSGEATLTFEPPLRTSPADNAPLTIAAPTATFIVRDATQGWDITPGARTTFALEAVEFYT